MFIKLVDALNLMDEMDREGKPLPFSIRFVTCDRRRKRGGEIITMPQAIKSTGTPTPGSSRKTIQATSLKSPRHSDNSTRNLRGFGTDQIRKVHIRLILDFNGQTVVY